MKPERSRNKKRSGKKQMDSHSSARPIDTQFDIERFNLISLQKTAQCCVSISTLCIFMARMSEIPIEWSHGEHVVKLPAYCTCFMLVAVDETEIRQSSQFDFFCQRYDEQLILCAFGVRTLEVHRTSQTNAMCWRLVWRTHTHITHPPDGVNPIK